VVALVAERPIDRGRLMISTYSLREHLGTHPVATIMMRDLIARTGRSLTSVERTAAVNRPPVTMT
jgi:hypothetical protein